MASQPVGPDMAQQIAQVKGNSIKYTNTAIRGVQGGFVVSGQMQYLDPVTKGVLLTENAEGVANTPEQATLMSLSYHKYGAFEEEISNDKCESEPNMFARDNPFNSQLHANR